MILPRTTVSNSKTNSSHAGEDPRPVPPPCTGPWESADRIMQEPATFYLTFHRDPPNILKRPTTHFEFVRSVS